MKKKPVIFIVVILFICIIIAAISWFNIFRTEHRNTRGSIPVEKSEQPSNTPSTDNASQTVKIYLIAIEGNDTQSEKIGCNDQIIAVERKIPSTKAPLTQALQELFSLHDQYYGQSGLYNALYQSQLSISSVSIDTLGKATIKLTGKLQSGGVCDDPRIKAQITKTALQFPTVKNVEIFINEEKLDDLLSGK